MKCTKCGCERADYDVLIEKLDGKGLPRKFWRCFCLSCGATHVSDKADFCVLSVDFSWEVVSEGNQLETV